MLKNEIGLIIKFFNIELLYKEFIFELIFF